MIQSISSHRSSDPYKRPSTVERVVKVEVVFGTPSKFCTGDGICVVAMTPLRIEDIRCPYVSARASLVPGEGLVFRFFKSDVTSQTRARFFSDDWFKVEERFALPLELARKWRLKSRWIPPGLYRLEEYSREWRLFLGQPDDKIDRPISANRRLR